MQKRHRRLHPVDEQLLARLADEGIEYVPVLAAEMGVAPGFAEQRVERLVEADLVERVTPEPVYRVTAAGQATLEATAVGTLAARGD